MPVPQNRRFVTEDDLVNYPTDESLADVVRDADLEAALAESIYAVEGDPGVLILAERGAVEPDPDDPNAIIVTADGTSHKVPTLTGDKLEDEVLPDRLSEAEVTRTALLEIGSLRAAPVATESVWYDGAASNGVVDNGNSRKRHTALSNATGVRLGYANIRGRDEVSQTQTITVRAGLELANGFVAPVFFGGKRSVTIEVGAIVFSDPVGVELVGGQFFWTRTNVTVAAGGKWPQQGGNPNLQSNTVAAWGEGADFTNGVTQADKTLTGTIGTNSVGHYSPFVVVGVGPSLPSTIVGITGDSITSGLGDSTIIDAGRGFVRRALGGTIPYISIAASGESALEKDNYRRGLLRGCTSIITNLGVNDLINNRALETFIKPDLIRRWTDYAALGAPVFQCTITPVASSADWSTTVQTPFASSANRIALNNWIRAGAPIDPATRVAVAIGTVGALVAGQSGHPLAGYFETADTVETARDSGIWKPNYTADGTHPTTAGHIAMAAAVNVAALTL